MNTFEAIRGKHSGGVGVLTDQGQFTNKQTVPIHVSMRIVSNHQVVKIFGKCFPSKHLTRVARLISLDFEMLKSSSSIVIILCKIFGP